MKKYREVNWSEVVRRSIEEYIRRLEETRVVDSAELLEELAALGVSSEDLLPLSYEVEKNYYSRIGEADWSRLSSTRAK